MSSFVYSRGAGRRPRRTSKMPRSSFTADIFELTFLRAYSGRNATVSSGIQQAVRRLVEIDAVAAEYMRLAHRVVEQAEKELELDNVLPTQINVWSYASENFDRIVAELNQEVVTAA